MTADRDAVKAVLDMPYEQFDGTIRHQAREVQNIKNRDRAFVSGLIGYTNHCKNWCLYCGMRAGCTGLKRYRMSLAEVKAIIDSLTGLDIHRLFLIAGEDPHYSFEDVLEMVRYAKTLGMFVSLALGELSPDQYCALDSIGADEYVLKFETSDEAFFNRIKPSTTFERRMQSIQAIRLTNMRLASGNIVGLPGQTSDQIADDIMLMRDLDISWAPIIPYLPVPGTPLAQEGGRGSLETLLKEIAILRIMMPTILITAQQPGEDPKRGLADEQGNLNALNAGANAFFIDMLPKDLSGSFHVISNRVLPRFESVKRLCATAGMRVVTGPDEPVSV